MGSNFRSLVAKSRTFAERVAPNPVILAVMDQLLGPRCERYQLHVYDPDRQHRPR